MLALSFLRWLLEWRGATVQRTGHRAKHGPTGGTSAAQQALCWISPDFKPSRARSRWPSPAVDRKRGSEVYRSPARTVPRRRASPVCAWSRYPVQPSRCPRGHRRCRSPVYRRVRPCARPFPGLGCGKPVDSIHFDTMLGVRDRFACTGTRRWRPARWSHSGTGAGEPGRTATSNPRRARDATIRKS